MYNIYTDGSSRPHTTGAAGWAYAVQLRDKTHVRYGHLPAPSTNNIAELTALLVPLRLFGPRGFELHFFTDSQYVVKGITEYMKGWKFRGWKTASGAKVKNLELWKEIHSLWVPDRHKVSWVRGHNGHTENELVDVWANRGADDSDAQQDTSFIDIRRSYG